jgi:hypothetical protein
MRLEGWESYFGEGMEGQRWREMDGCGSCLLLSAS